MYVGFGAYVGFGFRTIKTVRIHMRLGFGLYVLVVFSTSNI